jgi:hypothetical protein
MRSSLAFLLLAIPAAHAVTYASSGGTGTCATDGSSYGYTETVGTSTRTIATNLCPNHPYDAPSRHPAQRCAAECLLRRSRMRM